MYPMTSLQKLGELNYALIPMFDKFPKLKVEILIQVQLIGR